MRVRTVALSLCVIVMWTWTAAGVGAQSSLRGDSLSIARATGRITIDGDLSEEAWKHATRVEKWYETNPGDNTEPKVKNVGYLTYDDRFFYAAFEFDDPDPRAIRSPFADHDNVPGFTDYGGVIIDTRNDGHSATMMLANAHGIQYDAITDDAGAGEDSSPDFFWESAARITPKGWTLELRVPFSSLRYRNVDPQTWGILLYRNYPRDRRYQFFSARLPRGGNCFICRENVLTGLERLPAGGHIVAAPYVAASEAAHPRGDLGTPLVHDSATSKAGLDVKWTPNADNAVDLTVKPDFSQVESDTAQITSNERFALSFPEKRPFFLEGVELLSTPIQAVYTRTITAPSWGARLTGKEGGVGYTALVAEDAGGGSVILPDANGSSFAPQDFRSRVLIARAKRDIGRSFVSVLVTDRETDGNGHNRVAGPDFQWRWGNEVLTGQWLVSDTLTPNRPDVAPQWTGASLASHAGTANWSHNTTHLNLYGSYKDFGEGFRADTGFVPQVGYKDTFGQGGYVFYPTGFLSRLQPFIYSDRQVDRGGELISRQTRPGVSMNGRWNSFMQFQYSDDRVRAGTRTLPRHQFLYIAQTSPSGVVSQITVSGSLGGEVDFANARSGRGETVNVSATLHPTDHLDLQLLQNQRWLNVDDSAEISRRLFVARVSRVRATYTLTARSFARFIAQYVSTNADPALYTVAVPPTSGSFAGSALFAYKLNWQSVMFVGYGDDRTLSDQNRLEKADRQLFVKVSYAFQR